MHNAIVDTYREDFPKYVGSQGLAGMVNVFSFAARNVGRKVKYVHFSTEDTAAATKARIELLCMARVLAKVVPSHCNGLPLQAEADPRAHKLLFMDIGLMNAVCGLGWTGIERMDQTRLVTKAPWQSSSSASTSKPCWPPRPTASSVAGSARAVPRTRKWTMSPALVASA